MPVLRRFFKSRARTNSVPCGISFHPNGLTSRRGLVMEVATPRSWFWCSTTEDPPYPRVSTIIRPRTKPATCVSKAGCQRTRSSRPPGRARLVRQPAGITYQAKADSYPATVPWNVLSDPAPWAGAGELFPGPRKQIARRSKDPSYASQKDHSLRRR
jgi:hypothetical protein